MAASLAKVHTFLVSPMKGVEGHKHVGGSQFSSKQLQDKSKLIDLFHTQFGDAEKECKIEIALLPTSDSVQQNDFRDLLVAYLKRPTLGSGRRIATRLESVTTKRSSLGLLFLLTGKFGGESKVVLSRFPADSAILAEQEKHGLTLEFLDRVFMKSHRTYKSAVFQHSSFASGFWSGWAVDKQLSGHETEMSNYWISEFLASDFKKTAAAGSKMLATALREASKKATDISIKHEIASAVTLAKSLAGKLISVNEFADHFGLSSEARELIKKQFPKQSLINTKFQLDITEFQAHVPIRTLELGNGAILSAGAEKFEKVFDVESLDDHGRVRVTTEGAVRNEKLGRSK